MDARRYSGPHNCLACIMHFPERMGGRDHHHGREQEMHCDLHQQRHAVDCQWFEQVGLTAQGGSLQF
jgi:hypothetical protein